MAQRQVMAAPIPRLPEHAAPIASCRICSASVVIGSETAEELSAELRAFMQTHRHAGVADLVIDIRDLDRRASAG